MFRLIIVLIFGLFTACSAVERTTGRVLGNAGDAISTGEKKIWLPSEEEEKEVQADQGGWEEGYPKEGRGRDPYY